MLNFFDLLMAEVLVTGRKCQSSNVTDISWIVLQQILGFAVFLVVLSFTVELMLKDPLIQEHCSIMYIIVLRS